MDEAAFEGYRRRLADAVIALGPGERVTTEALAREVLSELDEEALEELLYEQDLDLQDAVEGSGTLLDDLHHAGGVTGLRTSADYVVRKVANRQRGRIALDDVEGIAFSSGGFFSGWKGRVKIKQYDVVLLKNGLKAQIVEILKGGEMYVADVEEAHGWEEDETIFVAPDEIEPSAREAFSQAGRAS